MSEGRLLSGETATVEALELVDTAASTRTEPSPVMHKLDGQSLRLREQDVLSLLAAGLISKEIGKRLDISMHTANFHVAGILKKLGVTSRVEAATMATQRPFYQWMEMGEDASQMLK